jgi:predicted TIM-barrel fold metal-dependent hydrolase
VGLDVAGKWRYPSPDERWLAQHEEVVIAPDLPIIDAHHHLWEEQAVPYLGPELCRDIASGHNIIATVFVQAHYGYRTDGPVDLAPVGETEKVVAIAREVAGNGCSTRVAEGIVGFADLMLGSHLEAVLDAHAGTSEGRLRGIRHSVSRDEHFPDGIVLRPAPRGMLGQPAYRNGLRLLAQRGLVYDAMLYHTQIPELAAMARALPELTIVLDHLGCIIGVGPYEGRERETFVQWRAAMSELATCPNIRVKLGGMGMIICGARWHERPAPPSSAVLTEAWRPYFETCIELFGANRCMFESNFPVDKAMYSYRTLWNAFKLLAKGYSADERTALFSGCAASTYDIDISATHISAVKKEPDHV